MVFSFIRNKIEDGVNQNNFYIIQKLYSNLDTKTGEVLESSGADRIGCILMTSPNPTANGPLKQDL